MSLIEIKYNDLSINEQDVSNKILELLNTIEKINVECNDLLAQDVWEGNLSIAFSSIISKLYLYANNNIKNINETNSFKSLAISNYEILENKNSQEYLG